MLFKTLSLPLVLLGLAAVASAQDVRGRRIITRKDLAEVVTAVDARVAEGHLLPATESLSALARTNDEFDRISRLFLGAQLGEAMEGLLVLATDLGADPPVELGFQRHLRADIWARDAWRDGTLELGAARIESASPAPGSDPVAGGPTKTVRVRLRTIRKSPEQAGKEVPVEMEEWSFDDGFFGGNGMKSIGAVRFDDRGCLPETEMSVVVDGHGNGALTFRLGEQLAGVRYAASPPDGQLSRALLEERAAALAADCAAGPGALRAFRSRLALDFDAPSPEVSAEFLRCWDLARSLEEELATLERGDDPFAGRVGDHWRTFVHGRRDLAARVYLPASAPSENVAVVIAFHGAGGDENFLFELAGHGHIKRLADQHGCLVVTPFTPDFLFSTRPFDSLLAGIAEDFAIDPARVHVLGHSMGTAATRKLVEERADRIAGACCVAGFGRIDADDAQLLPPILVVQGERDRIVPTPSVRRAALAARGAGVTYVELEDQGHTLLLPDALDMAFARWFD